MAGDDLDSDDSDRESDDDGNDEDPDNTEGCFDESSEEKQQSQVDELKLKVIARAQVLTQNRPQNLVPHFGNEMQKPSTSDSLDHQQPDVWDVNKQCIAASRRVVARFVNHLVD